MARDIGTAGEAWVMQWCALSGITANKSQVDRFGWDLHFEIPHSADVSQADGLHQADFECKVQIKTTDSKKTTEPVELSNLRAMATSTLPAFYILLSLGGGDHVVSARLLHVDDALCEKILKRIRIETAKPGKLNLNKKTMTLDFKKGAEIVPPGGEALKALIQNYIGPSQADYVVHKQAFLKTTGYESKAFQVQFQIDLNSAEKFARMLLGDNESVEVKSLDTTVTRFGISEKLIGLRSDTAIMRVSNILPDGAAKVLFRNRITGATVELDFDIFRGGAVGCLPPEYRVVRLKSTCFSIDMSLHKKSMTMVFDANKESSYDVTELLKNYKLVKLLSNPSEVDIRISYEGNSLEGNLGGEGFVGNFERTIEMLESTIYVKNYYDYYDKIRLSLRWFEHFGGNVINYKKLIGGCAKLDSISFALQDAGDVVSDVDCIFAFPIVLDGKCFVSLIVYSGRASHEGHGRYQLVPTKMLVIYKTYFSIEALASGSAMRDLEQAAIRHESDVVVLPFITHYMDNVVANAKRAQEMGAGTSVSC